MVGSVPDIPSCATQGESLDEAISTAADALVGHLAVARDYGDEVPEPRSLDETKGDKEWCTENGIEWGKAMAAPIMARPPFGKPERVTTSMDSNILRAIDIFAEKRGQTRSSVLTAGAELLLGRDIERMQDEALQIIVDKDLHVSRGRKLLARHARAGESSARKNRRQAEMIGAKRKPKKA